jgi:hypothetical protein
MNREPHAVEIHARAIAHEYFWCVAGRHQACVEQLQDKSDVPNPVWLTLCFEPLLFGLSFFGEYAQKSYTTPEQTLFTAGLDKATRWLLATVIFEPYDGKLAPSPTSRSVQIEQPARSRWVFTKGHERALAPFSRWCERRQQQFQTQKNARLDSNLLVKELTRDLATDGYRCPDSVLHVFAKGVVSEAWRIRAESASAVLKDSFVA